MNTPATRCQHNPLRPNPTLRVESDVFGNYRIHCLVCDSAAAFAPRTGKITPPAPAPQPPRGHFARASQANHRYRIR
jgi:hypothetical protein